MRNLFNMDNPVFRTLGKLADLMILNICFIICCLPVFTIGAALTGMNYVTLKIAEEEEGYIAKGFFKSFRQNFKQATVIWLILLVFGVVLGLDFYILSGSTGTMVKTMRIILLIVSIFYAMVLVYVFPVLARFDNPIKVTMKNSLIMAIADFPRTIVMVVITVGSVLITLFNSYTIAYGLLIWILFGFSLVAYLNCLFMKKVFAKYMPKEEEEETDPDSWTVEETEEMIAARMEKEAKADEAAKTPELVENPEEE